MNTQINDIFHNCPEQQQQQQQSDPKDLGSKSDFFDHIFDTIKTKMSLLFNQVDTDF